MRGWLRVGRLITPRRLKHTTSPAEKHSSSIHTCRRPRETPSGNSQPLHHCRRRRAPSRSGDARKFSRRRSKRRRKNSCKHPWVIFSAQRWNDSREAILAAVAVNIASGFFNITWNVINASCHYCSFFSRETTDKITIVCVKEIIAYV